MGGTVLGLKVRNSACRAPLGPISAVLYYNIGSDSWFAWS